MNNGQFGVNWIHADWKTWPFSAICRLELDGRYVGAGWFVSTNALVTAAHVLGAGDGAVWVIETAFGRLSGGQNAYYEHQYGNPGSALDFGFLLVDGQADSRCGVIKTSQPSPKIEGHTCYVPAFDPFETGWPIIHGIGGIALVGSERLLHTCPAENGFSGSPVFVPDLGAAVGVHVDGGYLGNYLASARETQRSAPGGQYYQLATGFSPDKLALLREGVPNVAVV